MKLRLRADTAAATALTLGNGVSRTALDALADGQPVSPSLLDVFLKWIARQSGSSFLDTAGLQDMSKDFKPAALDAATPT